MVHKKHIRLQGAVSGESGVHFVDGMGVEVPSLQECGGDYPAGRERRRGFLPHPSQRVCHSFLLGS